jgi:hypothetical protein
MGLMRETLRPAAGLAALHIPEGQGLVRRTAQGERPVRAQTHDLDLIRMPLKAAWGPAALHIPEDKRPIPRVAQGATAASTRVPLLAGHVGVFSQAVAANTALLKGRDDLNEVATAECAPEPRLGLHILF